MIRPVTASDRETYLTLCREFYHSPAVLHPVAEQNFETTFDALMSGTPYAACYLLEVKGQAAGYALLAKTFSQEAGGETWWIEELYLRPEYRGHGLGTEFFAWLMKQEGVKRFRLEIEPDNTLAKKLYERVGFSSLGYEQMILETNRPQNEA